MKRAPAAKRPTLVVSRRGRGDWIVRVSPMARLPLGVSQERMERLIGQLDVLSFGTCDKAEAAAWQAGKYILNLGDFVHTWLLIEKE